MTKSKGGKIIDKILDSKHLISILCFIGFIIGGCMAINVIDYTPATEDDYKPLLAIQENIIKDFDNIYNYPDADIDISKNNISISVENKECGLNIIFDKNTNYLYTEKSDNSISIFMLIFAIIFFGIIISAGFILISLFILFGALAFFEWLYEKRKKAKIKGIRTFPLLWRR